MKIKRDLPQFEGVRALIIATGRQRGVMYVASDSMLEKVDEIKLDTPVYSDREGHFVQSGKGGTFASGAVYENQKEYIQQEFMKQLSRDLSSIVRRERITESYIFAPRHLLKTFTAGLPALVKKTIKTSFGGNYPDEHPFELLGKIAKKRRGREDISLTPEEAKIKATPRLARRVSPRR